MLPERGWEIWDSGSEFRILGFRVGGSGFRVQGSGFRFQGSGFRVQGSEFRVQGSGFRVQGWGVPNGAVDLLRVRNDAQVHGGRRILPDEGHLEKGIQNTIARGRATKSSR